ncbi:MAG: TetR family transcriptional regulator [Sphingomonas sp.]
MNANGLSSFTGTTPNGSVATGDLRTLVSRRSILGAARTLLQDEGYRTFSMEAVASLAGVTRRTVYNLFPDRDALYRASRAELLREFEPLLLREVASLGRLRDDLEAFGRNALAALATDAHRELLGSVRRDAGMVWLIDFYRERVEQPLCRTLEEILMRYPGGDDAAARAGHAAGGVALLRAAVGEGDAPVALGAREFAWIMAARLGAPDGDALQQSQFAEFAPEPVTGLVDTERRPMVRRGAVTITFDPVDVRWNGIRVALSPLEGQLFALVARRGRVPWAEIDSVLDARHARTNTREVLLFRLRRKFADIGAGDPLETVRGWGLRFRVEPDTRGSRTLWIGISEAEDVQG